MKEQDPGLFVTQQDSLDLVLFAWRLSCLLRTPGKPITGIVKAAYLGSLLERIHVPVELKPHLGFIRIRERRDDHMDFAQLSSGDARSQIADELLMHRDLVGLT